MSEMGSVVSEFTWNTRRELRFIEEINSLELMQKYCEGLELRSEWDGLDKLAILAAAARRVTHLEEMYQPSGV